MHNESFGDRLITPYRLAGAALVVGLGVLAARAVHNRLMTENEPIPRPENQFDRQRNLFMAVVHGEIPAEEYVQEITSEVDYLFPASKR